MLEAKIVTLEQLVLVGFSFFGDPFQASSGWTEENEIGRLWQRFFAYLEQQGDAIKHIKNRQVCYEVHVEHEQTARLGHFEVFIGLEVERLEDTPVDLLVKILPAAQYAVFTLRGQQIISDWSREIRDEWLPTSGYQAHAHYGFQYYDQRFKDLNRLGESELDVYVPVEADHAA